ncbi:MAG: glycosyltransferase family 4 protein, partial [Gemmataceae bacterium]
MHLYASRWDPAALPAAMHYHRVDVSPGPRFLRPWRFAAACERALAGHSHDVSIGFDKTWGQDILYPQGGLHAATAWHNTRKYRSETMRWLAIASKWIDPASWSFSLLEQKQYFGAKRSIIVANSQMVRRHFEEYYGIAPETVRIVPNAIDPARFQADDRLKLRAEEREQWGVLPSDPVGLFVGMNYRLKGLDPLLWAMRRLPQSSRFRLIVVGHRKFGEFERLAHRYGVAERVRFLGFRADPKSCYFGADFLVHPTFYDPCSLVGLEALACGLPVITTRYNGVAELIPAEAGIVVTSPHHDVELAQAIETVAEPQFRQRAASAARQAANRWTFDHHYAALCHVFQETMTVRRAA